MRKMIMTTALILLFGMWGLCAFADDQGDILNELDSYMDSDETKMESSKGIVGQFYDHFSGELEIRSAYFMDSAFESSEDYLNVEDERVTGKVRANWSSWMGEDWWSLHAAGWFEDGTEDAYSGVTQFMTDKENQIRYGELNELFFNLSRGEAGFTIGKKIFKNGISTIYSPGNLYTSADLSDPVNPVQTGSWQMSCDYSSEDTVYTYSILPFYQEKKLPSFGSRWILSDLPSGYSLPPYSLVAGSPEELLEVLYYYVDLLMNGRFIDLINNNTTIAVREDLPGNGIGDWGWFGRVKKSSGMLDSFASAYYGPAFYPVIKLESKIGSATLTKETPKVIQFAGGFSTTWKGTELHGEALYSYSPNDHDDSYLNYSAGFCSSIEDPVILPGIKKIDFVIEYAGEVITEDQSAKDYILSSKYTRIGRNDILASALATITDDLSLHYLSDFTLSENSSFQRIGASLRVMPGVVLSLDFELFQGPPETYFGRWHNNDRIVTSVKWSI